MKNSIRCCALAISWVFISIPSSAEEAPATQLEAPVKASVSGKFIGDGKPSDIRFVTVEGHEQFSGKDALTLIFTERDPKSSKKPSFDAMFGKLGSSLILNVFYDGGIFGCQVAHTAHKKSGFSALGEIRMLEFKSAGGNVSGHVSTAGTLDAFGQKWEVELEFAAPFPEKMRAASIASTKPSVTDSASDSNEPPKVEKPAKKSGPSPFASKLPLPADATDVDFKTLVKQIHCSSAQPVNVVTKDLLARLKDQGWKDEGGVKGPRNAILKQEKDGAKLTIMIQPAGTGSAIKIFTEGLDWTGAESSPAEAKKAKTEEKDDIEKAAEKMINDALKNIPKGF